MTTLLGPNGQPLAVKAAYGAGVQVMSFEPSVSNFVSAYGKSPQKRMARYLAAYRGWFYRAGSVIAADLAALPVRLTTSAKGEDEENAETDIPEPDQFVPFEQLDPVGQLWRLIRKPNPRQTWRGLIEQLQIRLDMAGNAFLMYDQVDALGLPTGIHGIAPNRMTPATDRSGMLVGWVMDYQTPNRDPVPFRVEEIAHIAYPSPNDDIWGMGVVEAIEADQNLADLINRHSQDVLQTGGRLAGMMWPKDGTLEEPDYQDLVRSWRNVANHPNAGKALLVMREPMDWVAGASNPVELGLHELKDRNRDDILAAFPIGPTRLGMAGSVGLNSGQTRKYEDEDYWRHTIHPRVDSLEENMQVGLVSRYEQATGQTIEFTIDEPDLDDAAAYIEKAAAFRALVDAGFDAADVQDLLELQGLKYTPPAPPPVVPPLVGAMAAGASETQRGPAISASETFRSTPGKAAISRRSNVVDPARGDAKNRLAGFLGDQRKRVATKVYQGWGKKTKAERKAGPDDWWDAGAEDAGLTAALDPVYKRITRGALSNAAAKIGADVQDASLAKIAGLITARGGSRITGINDVTRTAISNALALGTSRGYSVTQLVNGVPDEGFGGIQGLTLDNGQPAWDDYRAELIANTETAIAYNEASVMGWGEFGVTELVAIDGDGDEACAERDGQTFGIDEALAEEDHPNGTLDWEPVSNEVAA